MVLNCYQDLIVWQKAMDLVVNVYGLVKLLPREEMFSLSDQMKRAAVSIPSNIAEGQSRHSSKEFVHFLYISKGSVSELETQLLLCVRLEYMTTSEIKKAIALCGEIGKMLNALINKLSNNEVS